MVPGSAIPPAHRSGKTPPAAVLTALIATLSVCATASPDAGPAWTASTRTTSYVFETVTPAGQATERLRLSQHLAGSLTGLAGGRLQFRAAGRVTGLPYEAPRAVDQGRLSSAHLEARLGSRWRARLGRQMVTGGVSYHTVDGASVIWSGRRAGELQVWAGRRAPWNLVLTPIASDRGLNAGGRASRPLGRRWRAGLGGSYREHDRAVVERLVGWDVTGSPVGGVDLAGAGAWDLLDDAWRKVSVQARWTTASDRLQIFARALDRRPRVDPASWFRYFGDPARVRLANLGLRYERPSGYGAEVAVTGTFVDDAASRRLNVALLAPLGVCGLSVRLADGGDERVYYGRLVHDLRPWLRLEGEASLLAYTLWQDAPAADERDLTTLAARARARLRRGLDVLVEVQSLTTPTYERDLRLLCGIDLAAAGGAGSWGPDRGGWLP